MLPKGKADETLRDRYGNVILQGEYYLKGVYLQKARSKDSKKKKFSILDIDVYVRPDEVFETFVEINDDLCMNIDEYNGLSERVSWQM